MIGSYFKDCEGDEVCPQMVAIPRGSFTMGSPAPGREPGEEDRDDDEGPQFEVTIGYSLAVGVYEVTFDEWYACVDDGGCYEFYPNTYGWGAGRRPVIDVTWLGAQSYVEWLSEKTGKPYRLLSESEWEYAARAGTTTPFHFGETIDPGQANYRGTGSYGGGPTGIYRQQTVEVGSFPGNAFGLHDMHGNVWEWVQDCYVNNYESSPEDGSAIEGENCHRVIRGGSWHHSPHESRSAERYRLRVNADDSDVGFRVARTLSH